MDLMEFLTVYWQWIVLGLLVLDKIVAVTPCKWDDLILTGIKGALRSMTGRKLAMVMLVAALAASASACAVKAVSDLPAHEQALVYTDMLMDTCVDVEDAYLAEWGTRHPGPPCVAGARRGARHQHRPLRRRPGGAGRACLGGGRCHRRRRGRSSRQVRAAVCGCPGPYARGPAAVGTREHRTGRVSHD